MTTRVNARIDDQLRRALERYRKHTHQTVTEVVERALERLLASEGKLRSPRKAASKGAPKKPRATPAAKKR